MEFNTGCRQSQVDTGRASKEGKNGRIKEENERGVELPSIYN